MKLRCAIAAMLVSLPLTAQRLQADAAPADLVQQVQAADLLADLITYTVDRSDTRIKDAQAFLQGIGKVEAYQQAKPGAPLPRPLNYMLLFRGSLTFVEGDGVKYADQSIKDQSPSLLYEELTAAQYYNMHEFLHFNQQRQEFASIRAYLESIGQYSQYLNSLRDPEVANHLPATQPTPTSPQEVAKRMGEMEDFVRQTAWKEAQAKGTSDNDFNQQWPEQVKQYRQSVMARIDESQPGDAGFGKTQLAGSTPPPPSVPAPPLQQTAQYIAPQPDLGARHQLPPPVQSPYSNADYRAKDLSLWNMWDYDPRY